MRKIKKIVLHCTATEYGKDYSVNDIRKWHIRRGFKDVGYHYVIRLDGTLEVGRPVSQIGAHCVSPGDKSNWFNRFSIGIAYVGGLLHRSPSNTITDSQLRTLVDLVHSLCIIYDLDVDLHVICHNEVANKACPCFNIRWFLDEYHKVY